MALEPHQQAHQGEQKAPALHLADMQQRQYQQQELIKLLTQHFNHQFYQLASSAPTNLNSSPQDQSESRAHAYQQPTRGAFAGRASSEANSTGLNLITAAQEVEQAQSQELRSQASANTPGQMRPDQPAMVGGTRVHPVAPIYPGYPGFPLADSNLFSALGLNFTNNQLVLSLQQQSLLRAAKQYELDRSMEASSLSRAAYERLYSVAAAAATASGGANGSLATDVLAGQPAMSSSSKDMLKFSINTILGKAGSPSSRESPIELVESEQHKTRSRDISSSTLKLGDTNNELWLSSAPCDQSESSSSDTNSLANANAPSASNPIRADTINGALGPASGSPSKLYPGELGCGSLANYLPRQATNRIPNHEQHSLHQHQMSPNKQPLSAFLNAGAPAFPWTVASRGKPRRGMMRRAVFSDNQRVGLEKRFQLQKYISKPDRKKLAEKLGLRDSQVKIWFQNRRMKWRNSKERELLSAGGSREQTLPTRNNPNPDLSDVGETIKRLGSDTSPEIPFNK